MSSSTRLVLSTNSSCEFHGEGRRIGWTALLCLPSLSMVTNVTEAGPMLEHPSHPISGLARAHWCYSDLFAAVTDANSSCKFICSQPGAGSATSPPAPTGASAAASGPASLPHAALTSPSTGSFPYPFDLRLHDDDLSVQVRAQWALPPHPDLPELHGAFQCSQRVRK